MYKRSIKLLILCLSISSYCHALSNDAAEPIKLAADSATHNEKTGLSTYHGNVVLRQGSMEIRADSISINSNNSELIATGNPVYFQQQGDADKAMIKGQAEKIQYFKDKSLLTLSGHAYIEQDQAHMKSDTITYNAQEQTLNAGNNPQSPSRVQVIIPAKQASPEP